MKSTGPSLFLAALTVATAGLFQPAQAGTPRHGDSVAVEAGGTAPAMGAADAEGAAIVNSHNDPIVENTETKGASGTTPGAGTEACCSGLADVDGLGTAGKAKPKETQPQIHKAKQGTTGKAK